MKTFKELVDSGEFDQKRFDYISEKYAFRLFTPIKKKVQMLFKPEALATPDGMATTLYSLTEMVTKKIIHEMIMMLYHDEDIKIEVKEE